MLCDSCKVNNAKLHYTKIINGKVEELHLCENCALENQEFDMDNPFSIHKLFTGLFDNVKDKSHKDIGDTTCSNCGLTLSKFKKTGILGCGKCYDEFSEYLQPVIQGIHGHRHHIGKTPKRVSPDIRLQKEVEDLSLKLEEAVKKEEFERAAEIRDEIRRIKEELGVSKE